MKSPAVPLTPEQQKLAADHLKYCYATSRRFQHRAPYDELVSACQFMLVKSASLFDPSTGASFKTYLIRNLRWTCSIFVKKHIDQVRTEQLSIDVSTEDASRSDTFDLEDMIEQYATENEAEAIRAYLQTGKLSAAATRRGVHKERIRQLKGRFIERCRDALGLTRYTLGPCRPALMEVA